VSTKFVLGEDEGLSFRVASMCNLDEDNDDPTLRLVGNLCVIRDNKTVVISEIIGRKFQPYLVDARIKLGDFNACDIEEAHDMLDQETHELYSLIYSGDVEIHEEFGDIESPFGTVLVLNNRVTTAYTDSEDWICLMTFQAFLDQAGEGVNLFLIDMCDERLCDDDWKRVGEFFGKLGFRRVGKNPFLVRDPHAVCPRMSFIVPEEARERLHKEDEEDSHSKEELN
jgi:hypothetical protein